jgi:hypothetical protein
LNDGWLSVTTFDPYIPPASTLFSRCMGEINDKGAKPGGRPVLPIGLAGADTVVEPVAPEITGFETLRV